MPSLKIVKSHSLGKNEALKRVEITFEQYRKKYKDKISNFQQSWNSSCDELRFSFSTYGFDVSGKIMVNDFSVQLEGKIPLVAIPFKGRITSEIQTELDKIFA